MVIGVGDDDGWVVELVVIICRVYMKVELWFFIGLLCWGVVIW